MRQRAVGQVNDDLLSHVAVVLPDNRDGSFMGEDCWSSQAPSRFFIRGKMQGLKYIDLLD